MINVPYICTFNKINFKIIPNKFALHSTYNMKCVRNTFRTNIMMKKNSYNSKPLDITTPIMFTEIQNTHSVHL